MRTSLASETRPAVCYTHQDRPAVFVRIEQRTKPVPSTVRRKLCTECADKPNRDPGVKDAQLRRL